VAWNDIGAAGAFESHANGADFTLPTPGPWWATGTDTPLTMALTGAASGVEAKAALGVISDAAMAAMAISFTVVDTVFMVVTS
jgi:hypothetical protein